MDEVAGDGPRATAFTTRTRPTFASVEEERTHRLQRIAGACRVLGRLGFADGLLGHVTVRDPEFSDRLWVNPLGVSFRRMRVSDLVQVDHAGRIHSGRGPVNPVGLLLHAAVHAAQPDVHAMCHAHTIHGQAWSTLGRLLDPISQDACVFFERQALIVDPRAARDAAEARRFAEQVGDNLIAIQEGHGIFTTGATVDEAAWWFITAERTAQRQLLAEAAGTPRRWPEEAARGVAKVLGSAAFGWSSFQPLWDEIVESDPDLLN